MRLRLVSSLIILVFLTIACGETTPTAVVKNPATAEPAPTATASTGNTQARPMGMGMGRQNGMMARHHAQVPEPYAGVSNQVPMSNESLARGAEIYTTHCATCHGDGGMGDGPAGVSLNPPPSPIAHTSQMMGDDYLYWRIAAGGTPFETTMPAWGETLDEQAHWDVINYMRALGSGAVMPQQQMGGAAFDPQAQATAQATMLQTGLDQEIISAAEAEIFEQVHTPLESKMAASRESMAGQSTDDRQAAVLAELIAEGAITSAQADVFKDVHDRMVEAGLMQ